MNHHFSWVSSYFLKVGSWGNVLFLGARLASYSIQFQRETVQCLSISSRWLMNSEFFFTLFGVEFSITIFISSVGWRIWSQRKHNFNPSLGTLKFLPDLSEQFKINLRENLDWKHKSGPAQLFSDCSTVERQAKDVDNLCRCRSIYNAPFCGRHKVASFS